MPLLQSSLNIAAASSWTAVPFYSVAASVQALSGIPRSWMLEEMLNYFPDTDERVRSLRYSLDAQLLNPMALAMEGHQCRVTREVQARSFEATLNIDNRGVYYKCYVPSSVALGTTVDGNAAPPSVIRGRLPGLSQYVQLRAYDDSLERDTSLQPVAVSNPLLFTMTGTGYPQTTTAAPVQFPNTVSLVLSNLPDAARAWPGRHR